MTAEPAISSIGFVCPGLWLKLRVKSGLHERFVSELVGRQLNYVCGLDERRV